MTTKGPLGDRSFVNQLAARMFIRPFVLHGPRKDPTNALAINSLSATLEKSDRVVNDFLGRPFDALVVKTPRELLRGHQHGLLDFAIFSMRHAGFLLAHFRLSHGVCGAIRLGQLGPSRPRWTRLTVALLRSAIGRTRKIRLAAGPLHLEMPTSGDFSVEWCQQSDGSA